MTRVFPILLAALVVIVALPAAHAGDMIQKKDGSWLISTPSGDVPTADELANSRISIVREEHGQTAYRISGLGSVQQIDTADVAQVYHGSKDSNYEHAMNALAEGDAAGALPLIERAVSSRVDWVPQYAMYARVEAYRKLNQADEALKAIDELIEKFPRTKFLREAHRARGHVLLELKKDIEAAKKAFGVIAQLPGVTDADRKSVQYWQTYCDEWQGRREGDESKVRAAKRSYEEILQSVEGRRGYEEVTSRARYGVGSCLNALGEYANAISYFEGIVGRGSADPSVLPGAYIGLGDAYFQTERYVEARRAYLRVVVLWPDAEHFHARALLQAGKCFQLVRDEGFKANATRELRECVNRYGGTGEAREAQQILDRLQ